MGITGALKGVILAANPGEGDAAGWRPGTGMLLPMANVPVIERILDGYERAGVKETLIAAGQDTREAASLCGNGARRNMILAYRDQPEARGPWEIMQAVAAFAGEAVCLVTRGPVLLNAEAYLRAVQMYDENGLRGIRLWERDGEAPVDGDGSDGIYLLTPDACDVVNESGRTGDRACSFGSILNTLAGRGGRVLTMAMAPEGAPYDTSTPEAYLESNERLLESTARDTVPSARDAVSPARDAAPPARDAAPPAVNTAPPAHGAAPPEIMADNFSSPNLVLRPPVVLDGTAELERCRIGPGVCIGPGVRIGHGAAIEHSVIMAGADIGDGASISRAIIGKNASIANRSVVHGRADRVIVVRSRRSG